MLGLLATLFIYGVAITVALIITTVSKDSYYKKYRALEDELRRIKEGQESAPAPQPSPAPAPAPQVQTQAQPQVQQLAPEPKPVFAPAHAPQQTASQPAPQPAPQKAPLPTYSYAAASSNAAKSEKKAGSTAVGVSFSVGVLLMVIAAAVFISATWQTMLPVLKCIILLLVVSGVYALSTVSRKKLKLEKTSSVLYILGSLITPLAIFVGFLAFGFEDSLITLVCCALSLGVSGYIGYKIFGSKLQVAISYLGFVWSEIFICMHVMGNLKGLAFGMCLAAFISGLIYYIRPKLKFFDWFAEITAYVAVIGFFLCSSFGKDGMVLLIVSQVMYWVSLLMLTRRRSWIRYISALAPLYTVAALWFKYFAPVYPLMSFGESQAATDGNRTGFAIICICVIPILFAVYRFLKQDNPVSNALISAGMACVMFYASLDIANVFIRERLTDFLYYTALVMPVLSFGAVIVLSRFKGERAVYWYLEFTSLIILSQEFLDGALPTYIFLALAVAAIFVSFKYNLPHLQIASCAASLSIFLLNFTDCDKDLRVIVYGFIVLAVYGAIVFLFKNKIQNKFVWGAARYSLLAMITKINIMMLISSLGGSDISFAAIIVFDVIFTAITLFDTDNYAGVVPALTFAIAVMSKLVMNDVDRTLVSAIFVACYVPIGRFLVCERIASKNRLDWFTIIAGAACFLPALDWSPSLILVTFYILSFIGRFGKEGDTLEEKIKSKLRVILSAATGSFAICMATLDIDYSSVMDTEIRLFFLLAAALVIYLVIKPGPAARWIWFWTVAACIEYEALRALADQFLLPLTMVSVCSVGIFIYSFIAKSRSWFTLSIVAIFEFALLFAIVFWESKLWWMYLLVIGGILIATASANEYRRRKAIELGQEDKKIRLFEDWHW